MLKDKKVIFDPDKDEQDKYVKTEIVVAIDTDSKTKISVRTQDSKTLSLDTINYIGKAFKA